MNKLLVEHLQLLNSKDRKDYISEYEKIDKKFSGTIWMWLFWKLFPVMLIYLFIVIPLWKLAYPEVLTSIFILFKYLNIWFIFLIGIALLIDIFGLIITLEDKKKLFRKYFQINAREVKNGIQKSRTSKRRSSSSSSKKAI